MTKFTFNMPDIGEGIAEAEIVQWHKKVGDTVQEDEEFVDMMTDKATVPMESPVNGKILEIAGEEGDMVSIGSMLVVIEVEGEIPDEVAEENDAANEAAPGPKDDEVEERIEVENPDPSDADDAIAASKQETARAESVEAPSSSSSNTSEGKDSPPTSSVQTDAKVLASPAVRQRARELGLDLGEVKPAEGGRIRHGDLDQFLSYNARFTGAAPRREDEQKKVIGMRRRIAENMAASKRNIPHFSYVEECDVTDLEILRAQLNENRGDKPKLTILPLLISAICKTLPDFPMINARYDDEAGIVTRHGAVNMGMAAQTDAGLMVPVIRNAQAMNPWQLAREISRLADDARNGTAKKEDMEGGTLTVTSLGPLGGVATTPVINRPEVAIIGPNRIIERPMFVSDGMGGERIEKRKLMNISISCDHRVVDGWDAASFVQALKYLLEAPALILVD
ncbi:2-oxo acid dehydrogenase subunit E2 [Erythrobacter litoralis]|uniref:dihydrolipoamide acetyltransferase family protein n=1 Tax=Erythrobacter litoralis TaxID=39960 RepID=UPI002435C760|nr:dihydrolipoamide acetyltransferase family protein [Erythrobacter litoralis]MDG6079695.1 2-oxo acid dehydrogenase subunit E2 [Erythrobacter litoralis]